MITPAAMTAFAQSAAFPGCGAELRRALSKSEPVFAFLGGSITAGYIDNEFLPSPYPALLKERYPAAKILNLAVCGTPSLAGIIFTERQLKTAPPDVVFVEYAVNEEYSPSGVDYFESLIRKLLKLPSKPAVVLVLAATEDGYSCGEFMLELARHYGLAAVCLHTALPAAISRGDFNWQDYSADKVHPNADGHRLIAEATATLMERSAQVDNGERLLLPSAMFETTCESLRELPLERLLGKAREGEDFYGLGAAVTLGEKPCVYRFKAEFVRIVAVFIQHRSSEYGSAELFCDGKSLFRLEGNSILAWNSPIIRAATAERCSEHELELKKHEGKLRIVALFVQ